jgi:hypothetical protein
MQYQRHEILKRFNGLSHQEQLPVDRLVLCHDKATQLAIVRSVIEYLEDRVDHLDAELALKLEKQLFFGIQSGQIDAGQFYGAIQMELAA